MYKIPQSVLVVVYSSALEVLLIERADKVGFWQSVTGSIDTEDEPFAAAARREVNEELGIRAEIFDDPENPGIADNRLMDWQLSNVYDIYPIWRHRYAPGVTRNTEHVFGLQVPRDVSIRLSPREHINYRWLTYKAAAELCFSPSNAEAILHLPRFAR